MNDFDLRHYRDQRSGLDQVALPRSSAGALFLVLHVTPHSAHDEPMTGQTVCFTLIYFSFISNDL